MSFCNFVTLAVCDSQQREQRILFSQNNYTCFIEIAKYEKSRDKEQRMKHFKNVSIREKAVYTLTNSLPGTKLHISDLTLVYIKTWDCFKSQRRHTWNRNICKWIAWFLWIQSKLKVAQESLL